MDRTSAHHDASGYPRGFAVIDRMDEMIFGGQVCGCVNKSRWMAININMRPLDKWTPNPHKHSRTLQCNLNSSSISTNQPSDRPTVPTNQSEPRKLKKIVDKIIHNKYK